MSRSPSRSFNLDFFRVLQRASCRAARTEHEWSATRQRRVWVDTFQLSWRVLRWPFPGEPAGKEGPQNEVTRL